MSEKTPNLLWRILGSIECKLTLAWMIVIAVTIWLDPNDTYLTEFANSRDMIWRRTLLLAIFAIGTSVVIISGGIDLSSGSVIALSAVVFGALCIWVDPEGFRKGSISSTAVVVATTGALLSGAMVGTLHAWLITSVGLPPFVATLATLVGLRSFARGLAPVVTSGKSQIDFSDSVLRGYIKSFPCMTIVFLIVAISVWVLMSLTVKGRHIHAMGGNEQAAKLSGIRTDRLKWLAYVISGVTAAIVGILQFADEATAKPDNMARGYELNAIASSVIGGCSLQGGVGTIPGVVLGSLFLSTIVDAVRKIVQAGSDIFEGMIVGVVVVLAVTFSQRIDRSMVRRYFASPIGWAVIPVLGVLSGLGIVAFCSARPWYSPMYAYLGGGLVIAVLAARGVYELKFAKSK
jgi:ribose/xylose/arabinose/galactoside ABC-type transport system permease subunit